MRSATAMSLGLAASVLLLPPWAALAGAPVHVHRGLHDGARFHARGDVGHRARGDVDHRARGDVGHRRFDGRFHRSAAFSVPASVLLLTPPYVDAPAYADPPAPQPVTVAPTVVVYPPQPFGYGQAPAIAAAPPAAPPMPPMPTVVEFPTGRYELRGDGVTAPYVWVWIPNPPAAPPPAPEPSRGATPPPARTDAVYRWTDEQGTVFWTNRLDRIPDAYRPAARPAGTPS